MDKSCLASENWAAKWSLTLQKLQHTTRMPNLPASNRPRAYRSVK